MGTTGGTPRGSTEARPAISTTEALASSLTRMSSRAGRGSRGVALGTRPPSPRKRARAPMLAAMTTSATCHQRAWKLDS
jgi:hypothetical protein